MTTESLWGELPEPDKRRSPTQILKEQAAILSDATKNALEGEVRISPKKDPQGRLLVDLAIKAPTLGNYRFDVLQLRYDPLLFYPATVIEVSTSETRNVTTEESLLEAFRTLFQKPKLRTVIAALLRQATDGDNSINETVEGDASL